MIHHRQRLPFGLEPRHHRLGVHPQLDHFQRDPAPDWLGLLRDINHPATTLTQPLHQFVPTQRLAHRFVRCVGQIKLDGGLGGGCFLGQRFIRRFMRRQQRFQTMAKIFVSAAFSVEKFKPVAGEFCQRQTE